MSKSKIVFTVLAAVALAAAPALPADAAAAATGVPTSHLTAGAPGSPETAPQILGVPYSTLPTELDSQCGNTFSPFGELCLSYGVDPFGGSSIADFVIGDCNLTDNVFLSTGAGQGLPIVGNVRGAHNWDLYYAAQFFTSTGCQGGPGGILPPGNVYSNPFGTVQPWRSFTWIWWPGA